MHSPYHFPADINKPFTGSRPLNNTEGSPAVFRKQAILVLDFTSIA
jgi:hypothetical protein